MKENIKQEFEYQISSKTYIQKPLVLGQMKQLIHLLDGAAIDLSAPTLIRLLGDRLSEFLAIVLTEKGKNLKNKDLEALSEDIEFSLDPETAIKVIKDFFACNPIASFLEDLSDLIEKTSVEIKKELLKRKARPSKIETSEEETESEDTPSQKKNIAKA